MPGCEDLLNLPPHATRRRIRLCTSVRWRAQGLSTLVVVHSAYDRSYRRHFACFCTRQPPGKSVYTTPSLHSPSHPLVDLRGRAYARELTCGQITEQTRPFLVNSFILTSVPLPTVGEKGCIHPLPSEKHPGWWGIQAQIAILCVALGSILSLIYIELVQGGADSGPTDWGGGAELGWGHWCGM